jgi:hypothetical protein
MDSRRVIIFGAIICVLAMLAYLFVFADAPLAPIGPAEGPAP